jgi:hypothetical protein
VSTLLKTSVFVAIVAGALVLQPTPLASVVTQASGKGEITGKVVDAQGRPIADLRVSAEVPGTPSVTLPQTTTDTNGNFRIGNLSPDVYTLLTSKEDEGYPDSEFNFYHEGTDNETTVRVYADQVTPNVLIQLQKAAILKGRVSDSATGNPIEHFVVRLAQVSHPERFLQTGGSKGEFRVVAPPLPITVRVSAAGYEEWRYTTDRDEKGSLFLAPTTSHELTVVMRRRKS